jgi:hypothetical protein
MAAVTSLRLRTQAIANCAQVGQQLHIVPQGAKHAVQPQVRLQRAQVQVLVKVPWTPLADELAISDLFGAAPLVGPVELIVSVGSTAGQAADGDGCRDRYA